MRTRTLLLVLAAAFAAASPAAASVIDTLTDTRVVVRTYDTKILAASVREAALATANAILEATGLTVDWRTCDNGFVRRNPCATPLRANDLAVRFVRYPVKGPAAGHVTLGSSLIDLRLRTGTLATIYVDRVAALAEGCAVDLPTMLGRAVAHEIGHLLLGSNSHARTGLMQATWSRDMLRNNRTEDWQFTASDGRAMRSAVRVRSARQLAELRLGPLVGTN